MRSSYGYWIVYALNKSKSKCEFESPYLVKIRKLNNKKKIVSRFWIESDI